MAWRLSSFSRLRVWAFLNDWKIGRLGVCGIGQRQFYGKLDDWTIGGLWDWTSTVLQEIGRLGVYVDWTSPVLRKIARLDDWTIGFMGLDIAGN